MRKKNALLAVILKRRRKQKREFWVHPLISDRLVYGKHHTLHSKLRCYPKQFFKFYRMSVSSFDELVHLVGPAIIKQDTTFRLAITVEERVGLTLRYLATGAYFSQLSFEYLIGESTIRDIVKSTCGQIWNVLRSQYMPEKTEEDWIQIANEFYERTNFPNVIGAIDGKHIRIIQPQKSGSSFFNYKKFFSCVLMAWTDADYKFVHIDVGAYGSSSDSEIFKSSQMGKMLIENKLNIPRGKPLPNEDDGPVMPFCVVGDEAFGLSSHILRPYSKKNLNYAKRIFNYRHTRARRLVECTFGILANKWRMFHRPINVHINFAVKIIKAACILHNYVRSKDGITFKDTLYECPLDEYHHSENNRESNITNGVNVRQYLTSYFVQPHGSVPFQYDKV